MTNNSTAVFLTMDGAEIVIMPGLATVFTPSEYFVSTNVQKVAEIVMDFCLSLLLSFMGIINNILVIVVFSIQGFKDTVNISLTFIAFWDLVKCLAAAMQRMSGPVQLINKADAQSWSNVCVVVVNYLVSFATYVSSVLAAFVAVERCLCIIIPFKVKFIITPKVTFISCLLISVVVFGLFVVVWGIYDILWVFQPAYNRSILTYRYNDFFYQHRGPLFEYYNLSGITWPLLSFVVISVCTIIIFYQLRKSANFRTRGLNETNDNEDAGRLSKRDRQVIKMLLVIIIVYIISLSPRIVLYMTKYFIYEFYFLRLYHNLFTVICYVVFFFDILNSVVNLYILLYMSSSFRDTFFSIIPCCGSQKTGKNKLPG